MSDSAKGPFSGYLYQFERALYLLSSLDTKDNYVSIEEVDDISTHNQDGTVLITDQSKHSISESGSTFANTSYALWRTIELWIKKFDQNLFNEKTTYICSTNKKIPEGALVRKIATKPFSQVKIEIENLKAEQEAKLKETDKGETIKQNLKLIQFVLKNEESFRAIQSNIEIQDEVDLKSLILNKLHLQSDKLTGDQRENIFQSLYGWISYHSFYKWKNNSEAKFKKQDLDNKLHSIYSNPSIIKVIFRAKSLINVDQEELENKKDDLFVKQIQIINRREDAKERIIKKAIEDFIRYEIEHSYLINEVGDFTKEDFEEFIELCYSEWEDYFDNVVKYELSTYSEKEKDEMAIDIYDYIMTTLKMKFNNDLDFTIDNQYFKNGSFLKLSNIPRIGWHPEWEKKFKIR